MAAEYVKRMGERIATARTEKHWTQARLARKVEELRRADDPQAASIESATISRWETGKVEPSAKMKEYIAKALDVPVNYFMMPEPDKTRTPDLSLNGNSETQLDRIEANQRDILEMLAALIKSAAGEALAPGDLLDTLPPALRPDDEDQQQAG